MSRFNANTDFHPVPVIDKPVNTEKVKTGVVLTNLGTPDAPNAKALRVYLAEFLSDPRVVEIPRLVWLIILHGIILRVRPAKSAKLYESIWTKEGSPLLALSKKQQAKVSEALKKDYGNDVQVELAMRYGNPGIVDALQRLREKGVQKLIVLPLYPQYSGPTTGSTFDAVTKELQSWRWVPSLHFIGSYHDNDNYITALANSIQEYITQFGKPEKLVLSYHGMPKLFFTSGDPYYCFCQKTTRLVAQKLGLSDNDFVTSFQSRFGKAEWLKPYTDSCLEEFAQQGIKHVAIVSPAFSVDCLETLEELKVESKQVFLEAGGETFHYIDALNDRDDHILAIVNLVKAHL